MNAQELDCWIMPDGSVLNSIPIGSYYGFVYRITNIESGRIYIGQKSFWQNKTVKKGKRELERDDDARIAAGKGGRVATKKKVTKVSDWQSYYGSNDDLKSDVKELGSSKFKREILHLVPTAKMASYIENWYLYKENVLANPDKFYNRNISGKHFTEEVCKFFGVPFVYVRKEKSSKN